MRLYNVVKV